jgi:putative spermidine/putrescine transport system substrate-binding protein
MSLKPILTSFALLTFSLGSAFAEGALTITSYGGDYEHSQDEVFFKPFTNTTGTKVDTEEYNGEIAKIRAMVESGAVSWDVVAVDTQTALQGCDDGTFVKLDWSKIADRSKFVEGSTTDCAVGSDVWATVIAYDAGTLKEGPTTVSDLFDLQKFPGKRALQKSPFVNLEYALIADGVPPDKVYEVLKTQAGIDRAFNKLDTIKSSVVWWEAGAQPAQLLASGEVVMTTAWNGRIASAAKQNHRDFKIVWDGQVPDFDFWVVPKGTKHLGDAYRFLAFASGASELAKLANYIPYGPTNTDALRLISPDVLAGLPSAPQNMKSALSQDYFFWGDRGDDLRRRFNTWLAK